MAPSNHIAWLEVTTDPAAVAEARRLALENTDAGVRQLMQKPEDFRYENIDRIVKVNASVLLPAWRMLVGSVQEPFKRRLAAAKFLCQRRDDGGLAFLIDTVRTGKKQQRREALDELYWAVCNDAPWMRGHAEELQGELLKLFKRSNDDLIPMVAAMCKELDVPGAAEEALASGMNAFPPGRGTRC